MLKRLFVVILYFGLMIFLPSVLNPLGIGTLLGNFILQLIVLISSSILLRKELTSDVEGKTTFKDILWNFNTYLIALVFVMLYGFYFMAVNQDLAISVFGQNLFLGFILLGVLAPLTEEIVFRTCLYNLVPAKSKFLKIIINCFLFSIVHIKAATDFTILPVYLISALPIVIAYSRHNNVRDSFIVHMIHNSLGLISSL